MAGYTQRGRIGLSLVLIFLVELKSALAPLPTLSTGGNDPRSLYRLCGEAMIHTWGPGIAPAFSGHLCHLPRADTDTRCRGV